MKRVGVLAASAVVACASVAALMHAASTAAGVDRPVAPPSDFLAQAYPVAAEQALGRRVLVILADPGRPRSAWILESGRAPEGWRLFAAAASGDDATASALDGLAARAALLFDPTEGFSPDVENALALFAVKSVIVDDAQKGTTVAVRTLPRADPVVRLDGGDAAGARDGIDLAAQVELTPSRESAGWTFDDSSWEDALRGGAVTVDTKAPGRFVFPYAADSAYVRVNGAAADAVAFGPLLALDLPAGRSRVEIRERAPGSGEAFALGGAAGLVAALLGVVFALRPSRAEVEASTNEGASG